MQDPQSRQHRGAAAGDAAVLSTQAPVQDGVFIYASGSSRPASVEIVVCNLSGGAMNTITDLPIRVLTFR